jgi:hypothetical protein
LAALDVDEDDVLACANDIDVGAVAAPDESAYAAEAASAADGDSRTAPHDAPLPVRPSC